MAKAQKRTAKKIDPEIGDNASEDPKEPVNARLPPELIRALDELAKKNGINRSSVIAIACTRIVETGI